MKVFELRHNLMVLILLVLVSNVLNAQKIGYLDYELFLSNLSEVREINDNLKGIKAEYWNKGREMIAEYQQKLIRVQKKANDCFPENLEIEAEKLKQEQQKIVNFEKEMNTVLKQRTENLMNPLRAKLLRDISEVAKENGYLYIFNIPSATY